MNNQRFAVIGGDLRYSYLCDFLRADGLEVYASGVLNCSDCCFDTDKIIRASDIILLPIPLSRDGETLWMPHCEHTIRLTDIFKPDLAGKTIFAGAVSEPLLQTAQKYDIKLVDLLKIEELTLKNAALTAEGAIYTAIKNTPGALFQAKCLVLGFGRIGKFLAGELTALYADVTVGVRNVAEYKTIAALHCTPDQIYNLHHLQSYDFVFNTVPSLILNRPALEQISKDCLLIDLASMPGGIDFDAASDLHLNVIHALSLPGKIAPKAAAAMIRNTVCNYLKEEHL